MNMSRKKCIALIFVTGFISGWAIQGWRHYLEFQQLKAEHALAAQKTVQQVLDQEHESTLISKWIDELTASQTALLASNRKSLTKGVIDYAKADHGDCRIDGSWLWIDTSAALNHSLPRDVSTVSEFNEAASALSDLDLLPVQVDRAEAYYDCAAKLKGLQEYVRKQLNGSESQPAP